MAAKKATDAIKTALENGLVTQLRAVETAESLASGYLPDPEEYIKGSQPQNFASNPLVSVYATSESPAGELGAQRNDVFEVLCVVHWQWKSDADPETAEEKVELTNRALRLTILNDPTLGGEGAAFYQNSDLRAELTDSQATTMHDIAQSWAVHIQYI